jgi:membrane peptidoglycan carboxypeptidase
VGTHNVRPGHRSPSATGPSRLHALATLAAAVLTAGILTAVAVIPLVSGAGTTVNTAADTVDTNLTDIDENRSLPLATTVTDRNGAPIAHLYDQRRYPVTSEQVAQSAKDAIVAIEDRRFYEHDGVDLRGTARALAANLSSGEVSQGASTLDQQYIKNYLLLIDADDDAARQAATETSFARKLREMKMAIDLDRNYSKDEILTRYLNLVEFGHGTYGIEAAARTYFGTAAADLTVPQAALLAGMVQSTTMHDPYAHPEDALARRNTVLDAMVSAGSLSPADRDTFAAQSLADSGLRDSPESEPQGCIAAGDSGFFCDYALSWLADHGFDNEKLAGGGYTVKTSLDPAAQQSAVDAARREADPTAPGVSLTTDLIAPRENGHEVVAMASSRVYGLDESAGQTVLPLTHSTEGNGAGSIFKLFAAASGMEKGMVGLDDVLDVPRRVELSGMGSGGADYCPREKYCVENTGSFPSRMTLRQALATSPNTPFVNLSQRVGVGSMVELAAKLGLRSFEAPGSAGLSGDESDLSMVESVTNQNMGSFVLGPLSVNPVELANVSASIADHGRWCEPSPVLSVTDSQGADVDLGTAPCEQVLDPKVADSLAVGMSGDAVTGTAATAAKSTGWPGPVAAKTGTTETNLSAAFLGFTPGLAGASYAFNDGSQVAQLCTGPLRQCGEGNLFGGGEPARAFFSGTRPVLDSYGGPAALPAADPRYLHGTGRPAR